MLAPTMYPVTSKLIRINFPCVGLTKKRKKEKRKENGKRKKDNGMKN